MNIYRVSLITALIVFLQSSSFAQQKPMPKTLLWKITGRGLSQPSYLFGTMHLTDKRLFRLDDSVFHSITATQGFAMEINPEEMAAYVINEQLNNLENKQKLENILDPEDYRRHKKALGKKFKKDPDEITVTDIVQEKNKWVNEFMAKGEMPTMLDAYLYNMARKQGKWIGGIEDLVDQTGLQEDLIDVSDVEYLLTENNSGSVANKHLEAMVRMYQAGDISAMERYVNGSQSGYERDVILIRRNVKMARRMDSLSAIRSMFFAVGAAHLPGDSGVIDLLTRKGFTVEPVFSKTKINASDYKYKEVEIPWKKVTDPEGLYEVMMPGAPVEFKHLGLINMKFHMDLFNLTAYSTLATSSPLDLSKPDSLFLMLAKNAFKTDKALKVVVIDSAGILGREFVGKVENTSMTLRLYLKGNIFYMAMAASMRKDQSLSPDMKKFFSSFVINRSAKPGKAVTYNFIDSTIGVQFASPARLAINDKIGKPAAAEWKTTAYAGSDLNSGAYIFLMSKEAPPGRYILSDSMVMYDLHKTMEEKYGKLEKREFTIQGFPALMIEGKNISNENVSLKIFTTVRGSRNIVLMVVAQQDFFATPEGKNIFESVRLIPKVSRSWKYYTDSTNAFTAWAPAPFGWEPVSDTENDGLGLAYSYDSLAAISYRVTVDTLSEYYSVAHDSIYWNAVKMNMVDIYDSLISTKSISNGKLSGREFLIRKYQSNMYQRLRIFIYGNCQVMLEVNSQLKDLYEENAEKFYNDFKIHTTALPFNITTSKSKHLLQDLLSKDSTTKAKAVAALSLVDFYKEDSALLHAALITDYQMTEEELEENDINYIIAQKLVPLKSPGTIDFIKKNYLQLKKDSLQLREHLRYVLAQLQTSESITALADLVVAAKPASELSYSTDAVLYDSLQLALTFLNHTKALRSDSIHGPLQASLYRRLLDSGLITRTTFDEAESDFIKVAKFDLNAPDSVKVSRGNSWELLRVMGEYRSPAAIQVMNRYLRDSRKFVRKDAAILLFKQNQKVDPAVVSKLAADPETRLDFYNDLKEIKKEALFPIAYKNQKSFSESELYALSEDMDIRSASYVGSKTATVKGKVYRFHLWKITFDAEDMTDTYLAVIGGYPVDTKKVSILTEYSGYHSGKVLGEFSVNAVFDDFIDYRDKEEEE